MEDTKIRLLVLDLDGTLLNNEKKISERNRSVLIRAMEEKGLRVAIGSGRDLHYAEEVSEPLELDSHKGFIICNNGQRVFDYEKNEIIEGEKIPHIAGQIAMSYAELNSFEISGSVGETRYYHSCHSGERRYGKEDLHYSEESAFFDHDGDFDKIVVYSGLKYTVEDDHRVCAELSALLGEHCDVTLVAPHVIDLVTKGVTKVTGIETIQERYGLKDEEILVMGDGENDLPAALRYPFSAMANSMPRVKEAASRMTLSNEEDGVAYEVERSVLNVTE